MQYLRGIGHAQLRHSRRVVDRGPAVLGELARPNAGCGRDLARGRGELKTSIAT